MLPINYRLTPSVRSVILIIRTVRMILSGPTAKEVHMHPDSIDYSLIDPQMRKLVRSINSSMWIKTVGCCAGRAEHSYGKFYLSLEVYSSEGLKEMLKWLASAFEIAMNEIIDCSQINVIAVPEPEMVVPTKENAFNNQRGALMGNGWFRFDLRPTRTDVLSSKVALQGAIRVLELGWEAMSCCSQDLD